MNIHEGRGNAIQILARAVRAAVLATPAVVLGGVEAGTAVNSIPREASVLLCMPKDCAWDAVEADLREAFAVVHKEFEAIEPGMSLLVENAEAAEGGPLSRDATLKAIHCMNILPHGVVRMSHAVKDTPETSVSFSIARLEPQHLYCHLFARSFSATHMRAYAKDIESLAALIGSYLESVLEFCFCVLPNLFAVSRAVS